MKVDRVRLETSASAMSLDLQMRRAVRRSVSIPLSPLMTITLQGRLTANRPRNGSPVATQIAISSTTVVFRVFCAPPSRPGCRATSIWSIKKSISSGATRKSYTIKEIADGFAEGGKTNSWVKLLKIRTVDRDGTIRPTQIRCATMTGRKRAYRITTAGPLSRTLTMAANIRHST
jgi:hypothetical protein